ncbi:hypothetical protein ZEAMMB73_Zm00001d004493 [Zea mays]|jgi:hypothetical protein|uniref:Uncharacterized protein n=1 Tax=Zea mays TaxID=4577 RepID=A0A1D6EFR6_MAIZE|nr:hypothetical protein ZEAMMB73_Zm00001d004493 [Zea mays]
MASCSIHQGKTAADELEHWLAAGTGEQSRQDAGRRGQAGKGLSEGARRAQQGEATELGTERGQQAAGRGQQGSRRTRHGRGKRELWPGRCAAGRDLATWEEHAAEGEQGNGRAMAGIFGGKTQRARELGVAMEEQGAQSVGEEGEREKGAAGEGTRLGAQQENEQGGASAMGSQGLGCMWLAGARVGDELEGERAARKYPAAAEG